jgi:pseudouridine synthase
MSSTKNTVKLQAFMSHRGIASRRKSESLIEKRLVTVNGEIAHLGQRVDPAKDTVTFKGRELEPTKAEHVYILVDKPEGFVSTTSDNEGRRTVLNLLPNKITEDHRIYPVGRLDIDSQGLILVTNDGSLAQKLTHPSFHHTKTYQVLVKGIPSTLALNHLQRGVKLKEGYTKPDALEILGHENGNTWLEIMIHEGKNRQIRRMMDRIGYSVITLIRTHFGPFSLEMLEGKPYMILDKKEVPKLLDS